MSKKSTAVYLSNIRDEAERSEEKWAVAGVVLACVFVALVAFAPALYRAFH